jgi:hypothetical protein
MDVFPKTHIMTMLCEHDLLVDLIDGYFQYMENVEGRWELTKEFKVIFGAVMEAVRQKIITFVINALKNLDLILSVEAVSEKWSKCLRVYFNICQEFAKRETTTRTALWECLVNTLIL